MTAAAVVLASGVAGTRYDGSSYRPHGNSTTLITASRILALGKATCIPFGSRAGGKVAMGAVEPQVYMYQEAGL